MSDDNSFIAVIYDTKVHVWLRFEVQQETQTLGQFKQREINIRSGFYHNRPQKWLKYLICFNKSRGIYRQKEAMNNDGDVYLLSL